MYTKTLVRRESGFIVVATYVIWSRWTGFIRVALPRELRYFLIRSSVFALGKWR